MSLKAKLEAVIYAAEEPVTLTQLAPLFAADALEWKAEQEAAAALAPRPQKPARPLRATELDHLTGRGRCIRANLSRLEAVG